MPRIERVSSRSYAKIPNKVEKEIIDVMNRYFKSELYNPEDTISEVAKQDIISEIIIRMHPVIYKLSSEVANRLTQEALQNLIETLPSIEDYMSNFEYVKLTYIMDDNYLRNKVIIPITKVMFIDRGNIKFTINGLEQEKEINFIVTPRDDNHLLIGALEFEQEVLEDGDVVSVVYSFMESPNM